MNKELLITLPKRGLKVIPPQETQQNMARAQAGEVVRWSDSEKARLKLLVSCPILAKRYPDPSIGREFMDEVDYEWRSELLTMSYEMSEDIVQNWNKINSEKDIAVILFGSVAKGLVKKPYSTSPSNIDMAVIGNISDCERESLFDLIRPKRQVIQQRILSQCPYLEYEDKDPNPGNVGVIIQDLSKLTKKKYAPTIGYIASGACTLYDPSGIWSNLEQNAIGCAKR